ncbi:hypothetical protein BRADI_4g23747v3 [Brachypodium distachyon]|uniref:BTB domain-containing protein n=1 Tax=Brachypodium distachyon TaxID=15368 RepID=I1IMY1_BRADI|nr:hypothetical protein BRADI_4g23747v3 [Brachypodium distachyon]
MAERGIVTTSALVAGEDRRTHVIKIDGYSRFKELLRTGKYTTSVPFSVGGHNWAMKYFPNGSKAAAGYIPGHISVYLVLDSDDAKDVKAQFSFNIVDKDGVPVPSYSRTTTEHIFPRKGSDWGFSNFIKHEDLEGSAHLRGDSFRIMCDVTVGMKIRCEETKCNPLEVPASNLHQHLGDLLKGMDGADVTFQVGGHKFTAHRYVLAARSSVFKAELFGAMKEKTDSPIQIDNMESDVFESLLLFIYTDSLPVTDTVMAGHLLVAADRYNIERLKLICEDKLCNHIGSDMVATSLALAEQHSCHGLKEACFEFLASPPNLEAMVASDGYQHLKRSCPTIITELLARLLRVELQVVKDIGMDI